MISTAPSVTSTSLVPSALVALFPMVNPVSLPEKLKPVSVGLAVKSSPLGCRVTVPEVAIAAVAPLLKARASPVKSILALLGVSEELLSWPILTVLSIRIPREPPLTKISPLLDNKFRPCR